MIAHVLTSVVVCLLLSSCFALGVAMECGLVMGHMEQIFSRSNTAGHIQITRKDENGLLVAGKLLIGPLQSFGVYKTRQVARCASRCGNLVLVALGFGVSVYSSICVL